MTPEGNLIIEKYHLPSADWEDSGVMLQEEIKRGKSYILSFNDSDNIKIPTQVSRMDNDFGDKLLIVTYDNIIDPVPNMFIVSVMQGICQEIYYDKTGTSEVSTFHKKNVVYDKESGRFIAFSSSNALVVDFVDLNEGIYVWRSHTFITNN